MIITIGGNPGAGKTTLANNLEKALGYKQLYVGGILREMAAEKRITIEQFYGALKADPMAERAVDERQAKLMREEDNLIVQGRVSWHLVKGSPFAAFNILLTVAPSTGADRVKEKEENAGRTPDEVARATARREQEER